MKRCSKCHETKPLSEFYRAVDGVNGVRGDCKQCALRKMAECRAYDPQAWRIRDRQYGRRYRVEDPERRALRQENWRARNPEKRKAHNAVAWAMGTGKLVRRSCEVCGATRVHAHHDDYSKPLSVRWLCPLHHVSEADRSV